MHHCFLIVAHRPRVPTAPRFFTPACATHALAYILCKLNTEGFPFAFSSSGSPSPEAAFTATTSA
jgi:hypothetical protein